MTLPPLPATDDELGRIAYEAWCHAGRKLASPWTTKDRFERALWIAAAQAATRAAVLAERERGANADAIATLRDLDARLRECIALGLSVAEAYDSFYQEATEEALALDCAYAIRTQQDTKEQ